MTIFEYFADPPKKYRGPQVGCGIQAENQCSRTVEGNIRPAKDNNLA
jgi:hypothetical protein